MKNLKNCFVRDSIFSLLPQRTDRRSQRKREPSSIYGRTCCTVKLNCHEAPCSSADLSMGPRQLFEGTSDMVYTRCPFRLLPTLQGHHPKSIPNELHFPSSNWGRATGDLSPNTGQ